MRNRIKAKAAFVLILALCLAIITACSSKSNEPNSATGSASPTASGSAESKKEPVTLSLATYQQWKTPGLEAAIRHYEQATGNKIDLQLYPDDQFANLIRTKLATGDGPDLFADDPIPSKLPIDKLEPLGGPWIDQIRSAELKEQIKRSSDGQVVVAPYGPSTSVGVIYNKEVMKKAGVTLPLMTYQDLLKAAEAIKATGVTPIYIANKDAWPTAFWMYFGYGHVFEKDPSLAEKIQNHSVKFEDVQGFVDVNQRVLDFKEKGLINEDYMSATAVMAIEAVAKGEAAMFASGEWHYGEVESSFPELVANTGLMPVTLDDQLIDGYMSLSQSGLYVNAESGNKEAAKEFVNLFMSEEYLKVYYESSPGTSPLNIETKNNAWAAEMLGFVQNNGIEPKSSFLGRFLPNMKYGDFAKILGQDLLAGKSAKQVLVDYNKDLEPVNKAAKVPGW